MILTAHQRRWGKVMFSVMSVHQSVTLDMRPLHDALDLNVHGPSSFQKWNFTGQVPHPTPETFRIRDRRPITTSYWLFLIMLIYSSGLWRCLPWSARSILKTSFNYKICSITDSYNMFCKTTVWTGTFEFFLFGSFIAFTEFIKKKSPLHVP